MPCANEKPANSACLLRCLSCFESLKRDNADIALSSDALPFAPLLLRLICLLVFPEGVFGAEGFGFRPAFGSLAKKVINSPGAQNDVSYVWRFEISWR